MCNLQQPHKCAAAMLRCGFVYRNITKQCKLERSIQYLMWAVLLEWALAGWRKHSHQQLSQEWTCHHTFFLWQSCEKGKFSFWFPNLAVCGMQICVHLCFVEGILFTFSYVHEYMIAAYPILVSLCHVKEKWMNQIWVQERLFHKRGLAMGHFWAVE